MQRTKPKEKEEKEEKVSTKCNRICYSSRMVDEEVAWRFQLVYYSNETENFKDVRIEFVEIPKNLKIFHRK